MAHDALPPTRGESRPVTSGKNVASQDVAIEMVGEESHVIDPASAASAVRKIDWFFIPAMTVGVGLNIAAPLLRSIC